MLVVNVVIFVLVEFDLKQRNLIIEVVNFVGLKILRVINEFIVVVMVYGFYKVDVFYVLVIDLGGGILDVFLLNK